MTQSTVVVVLVNRIYNHTITTITKTVFKNKNYEEKNNLVDRSNKFKIEWLLWLVYDGGVVVRIAVFVHFLSLLFISASKYTFMWAESALR